MATQEDEGTQIGFGVSKDVDELAHQRAWYRGDNRCCSASGRSRSAHREIHRVAQAFENRNNGLAGFGKSVSL